MGSQYDTPNPRVCYEKYLDDGTPGQSHDARLPVVQSHLASHMKGAAGGRDMSTCLDLSKPDRNMTDGYMR
jgi:hypothetical protein